MKIYTVHEPAGSAADRVDRAEQVRFVSDGFDWNAALFTPFVLLGHAMLGALAVYAAALAAIVALLLAIDADGGWIGIAVAALHTAFGFEFGEMLRAKLDASGWADHGTVSGRTLADCERRFFDDWLPRQPLITGLGTTAAAAIQPRELSNGVARGPAAASVPTWSWLPWRR